MCKWGGIHSIYMQKTLPDALFHICDPPQDFLHNGDDMGTRVMTRHAKCSIQKCLKGCERSHPYIPCGQTVLIHSHAVRSATRMDILRNIFA